MKIRYTTTALKQIVKLDPSWRERIEQRVIKYASDAGIHSGSVKMLKGDKRLRLRVGDYRVIFTHDWVVLVIEQVGRRREISEDVMGVQFLKTPAGDELVVMPRDEWEALVEAVEDVEGNPAADQVEAAIAADTIEMFPGELVSALIHGANPVRTFRAHRGLTAEALAEKAGISRAYLTQIEAGSRNGTSATLRKLAAALGVDLELLIWK